ncbi:MAG: GNAT family N-acetyltransferase [Anaerolineae bacterium]
MNTITVRPGDLDDAAAVADMRNSAWQAQVNHPVLDADQIVLDWQTGDFDVARRVGMAVDSSGTSIGFVWLTSRGPSGVRLILGARGGTEGRAVRAALLDWAEMRGREVAACDAATAQLTVYVSLAPDDNETAAALESRGYTLFRVTLEMRVSLDSPLASPNWPPGVTLRPLLPDRNEEAVHAALSEAFETNWEGDRVPPFERWRYETLADVGYDPALWVVAVDEAGEVAGAIGGTRYWRGQSGVGGLFDFGVRPAWRRRGLGRAILLQSLRQFYARGYRTVALRVDAHNTPAVHLYEGIGMRTVWRLDTYARQLPFP